MLYHLEEIQYVIHHMANRGFDVLRLPHDSSAMMTRWLFMPRLTISVVHVATHLIPQTGENTWCNLLRCMWCIVLHVMYCEQGTHIGLEC